MKHKKGRDAGGESNGDGGSQKGGGEAPLSIQLDIVEHPGGGGRHHCCAPFCRDHCGHDHGQNGRDHASWDAPPC